MHNFWQIKLKIAEVLQCFKVKNLKNENANPSETS